MDYSKPIFFRPSAKDVEVLDLIAKNHPLSEESPTELVRKALEVYWLEHGPDGRNSKSARIARLEKKMDLVLSHLGIVEVHP